MKCPECQAELPLDAHFCPACGTRLSAPEMVSTAVVVAPIQEAPTISAEQQAELDAQRARAEGWLDAFLQAGGAADPAELIDEDGVRRFTAGTVLCDAAVLQEDTALFLHVDALIMSLPSDHDLILPLMRELLELNVTLRGSVRVGIRDEQIIVTAIRPVLHLNEEELAETVGSVIALSDRIDGQFLGRYGGTVLQRRPQPPRP